MKKKASAKTHKKKKKALNNYETTGQSPRERQTTQTQNHKEIEKYINRQNT